jgi:hypothetical protein
VAVLPALPDDPATAAATADGVEMLGGASFVTSCGMELAGWAAEAGTEVELVVEVLVAAEGRDEGAPRIGVVVFVER